MGRQVHIYFETSTTLRRTLSEKLIHRVRSSSLPTKFEQETEVMKPGCFLPFAAAFCAVASSGDAAADEKQIGLDGRVFPVRDGVLSSLDWVVDSIGGGIVQVAGAVTRTARSLSWTKADVDVERDGALGRDRRRSVADRDGTLENVWEVIRNSEKGRRFAGLVDGHEKLRKLLSGSDGLTVLVPTDEAFAKLDGMERSDEELMEEILEYHVLSAEYTLDKLRGVQTASSVLEESDMGRRQRVRVEGSSSGITLNFYSRVLDGESKKAANGIVHFVDNVLVPPPRHDKLIEALPEQLGTFSRAMKTTGVSEELHARAHGITLFTPSNEAWEALGAEVNTFLFSDEGLEYLRALARYHVLDEVVYSDIRLSDAGDEEIPSTPQFQTLLDDAVISVGINREKPVMVVNGKNVSVRDMPARDGIVHVLDEILIPSSTGSNVSGGGVLGVEELKRLLGPFVQAEGFASNEL
ncbi:fasciclin domain family protein [Colletotrichum truncatum]|uniref:Fasciclin domain family protein n=1 Tax=Colletotrichum truncatum TaxID=5467 RepID=A0ACC3YZW1_COLTU|nr:fasciclin domain family protein [Colletotrichum truncatum]KAF6800871.1 fasciclin domain family protein [Colletotrichum truncatum]